jgi:UDP-N-acetylglucosamine 2-epimerase
LKILSVVGARPEFVQVASLSRAIRRAHREVLVHTGQHYDQRMSKVFFEELGIPTPDYDLEVGSGSHAEQTASIMRAFAPVLANEAPDLVIVRGDTNSTIACALVAAKVNVAIAHVEAGERSFARAMPEEVNRVVVDHMASHFFCVSRRAVENLRREGLTEGVTLVGDVMHDALLANLPLARRRDLLGPLRLEQRGYALATIHRADNTAERRRLAGILDGLGRADLPVLLPLHPRTAGAMQQFGLSAPANVKIIEPLGYLDMLAAASSARVIVTDSGGLQREAYYLGVRCVTVRDETEWTETVDAGWNRLVGADADRIVAAITSGSAPVERPPIYGSGDAADRIVAVLDGLSA